MSWLNHEFTLERLYGIMEFARDVVDFRLVDKEKQRDVYDFLLNVYVYFAMFVRQSMISPGEFGRNPKLANNVFDRCRLVPRAEGKRLCY